MSCQGICLLNRHQTGDTDSVQPVILLPVQRDSQETFIPCEARMLWYSADRTSSQQLRDTTNLPAASCGVSEGRALGMRHHGFSCSSLYTVTPEQAQGNLLIEGRHGEREPGVELSLQRHL